MIIKIDNNYKVICANGTIYYTEDLDEAIEILEDSIESCRIES